MSTTNSRISGRPYLCASLDDPLRELRRPRRGANWRASFDTGPEALRRWRRPRRASGGPRARARAVAGSASENAGEGKQPASAGGGDAEEPAQTTPTEAAGDTDASLSDTATVQGRLTAVSDGTPGFARASALERKAIEYRRMMGRYKPETVEALAALMCGQRMLDRLTREQVRKLALTLPTCGGLAADGRRSPRRLVVAVS